MLFIITTTTTKAFAQRARGSRERFFVLRYYYYVNVTFSFTLRYRSGREAHRGSRLRTLAVTSQCRIKQVITVKQKKEGLLLLKRLSDYISA